MKYTYCDYQFRRFQWVQAKYLNKALDFITGLCVGSDIFTLDLQKG